MSAQRAKRINSYQLFKVSFGLALRAFCSVWRAYRDHQVMVGDKVTASFELEIE